MLPGFIFETARLLVRSYRPGDEGNFFAMNGDPQVMQYIRPVKTREESDLFLQEVIAYSSQHPALGRWAVEDKETACFVGSFAIIPIPGDEEKMQLGYSLLPAYWGKGYASELTQSGLDYFLNTSSLPVIYGVTESANVASQKVLLKTGFGLVDKKMEGEKELLIFSFETGLVGE